jgi:threonyl-tRNA synthetase
MFSIYLPDGKIRKFNDAISYSKVAEEISTSLAKKAVAVKINGELKELSTTIENNDHINIITNDSPEGLEILRHSTAHLLAQAVKELYGSKINFAIGPTIKNGFYYDFEHTDTFSTTDLELIEKKMQEIIKRRQRFERYIWDREYALKHFSKTGEKYKVELLEAIPSNEKISIYSQGDEFVDLCRGPHLPDTGYIKAFKLLKVSGAYWRGNSKNKMLQRIYGTAFENEKKLQEYLKFLEEAAKRDHRKIGKEMKLFHFQEEAPGVAFWHPRGWTLFRKLIEIIRREQEEVGYVEISTPEMMDRSLWERSGHWDKFTEQIFIAHAHNEEKLYAIRPMNCPGGIQIYKNDLVSYKQLPMKVAEFGKVYRFEPSGALYGLFRVRGFTQDDAHIYCTEEQLIEECMKICQFLQKIYSIFGFKDFTVKLAGKPEKRIGEDSVWERSEHALAQALERLNFKYTHNPGEGAFYGPKLEFVLEDALGREWQMGTLQVDFNLPERFDMTYITQTGERKRPVMLHRAILGALERFLGMLIEHYSGHFPLWLAPVQIAVLSIKDLVEDYAQQLHEKIIQNDGRAIIDIENETINYKIRKYSLEKIPIVAIIGEQEKKANSVSIRRIGSKKLETLSQENFLKLIKQESVVPKS